MMVTNDDVLPAALVCPRSLPRSASQATAAGPGAFLQLAYAVWGCAGCGVNLGSSPHMRIDFIGRKSVCYLLKFDVVCVV